MRIDAHGEVGQILAPIVVRELAYAGSALFRLMRGRELLPLDAYYLH